MTKKNKRQSEVIFASRHFPENVDNIEKAYSYKSNFDAAKKELGKVFNKLNAKQEVDLRGILESVKKINDVLTSIDINLYDVVCCNRRFINKREKSLKKARKNLSAADFESANDVLMRSETLAVRCEQYGLTYNKACALLFKVSKARQCVMSELVSLEKISEDPKKHFRSLYKNLNVN